MKHIVLFFWGFLSIVSADPSVTIDQVLTPTKERYIPVLYHQWEGTVAIEVQLLFDATAISITPSFSLVNGDRVSAPEWLSAFHQKTGVEGIDTLHIAAATALDSIYGDGVLFSLHVTLHENEGSSLVFTRMWIDGDIPINTTHGSIVLSGDDAQMVAYTEILQAMTSRDGWRQSLSLVLEDGDRTEAPSVLISNLSTGQQLHLILSGEVSFEGEVETIEGEGMPPFLGVSPGDSVVIVYSDSLTSVGYVIIREWPVRVITLWGDTDQSGSITAVDASTILQMAVESIPYDPVADVTGSGTATSLDAVAVLQWLIGLLERFPIQEP